MSKARDLFGAVGEADKSQYTKGEVRNLLNTIIQDEDGCGAPVEVDNLRRGDVFIAKHVGGKLRPWIVLSVSHGVVVAVALSSGDKAPRMIQGKCRLWPGAWIGTAVSVFDESTAKSQVTRPYTNLKHLREVEAHLAELLRLRPLKGRRS